jgi:hypothetical protein
MPAAARFGKRSFTFDYEDKRGDDDGDVFFETVEKKKRRPLHGRPLPRGLKFAVPQVIAELTNAKPSGRGWSGHCPCHDDQRSSFSISWGRKRNTVVHCHAGCSQEELFAYFRLKGLSLDPIAAARRLGADPYEMQRAFRLCSTSERRIFDALLARGDGPATYEQLAPYAGNNRRTVARALRGLEFLGLLRIERGKPHWSEHGWERRRINPPNVFTVASKRLFRAPGDDDDAVLDGLREARRSEAAAAVACAEQKNGSGSFATVSYVDEREGCGGDGGGGGSRPGEGEGEALNRPPPTGPQRGRPARAVRAFAAACAKLASGRRWVGEAHELLMGIRRPAGERSWPRQSRTLNEWLWMARADMAALGCTWTREWPDAATAQRLVLTVASPGEAVEQVEPPQEVPAEKCARPALAPRRDGFGRIAIDGRWAMRMRAFVAARRALRVAT